MQIFIAKVLSQMTHVLWKCEVAIYWQSATTWVTDVMDSPITLDLELQHLNKAPVENQNLLLGLQQFIKTSLRTF